MANAINTLKNAPGVIAKLAAGMLEQQVRFGKSIDQADESDWMGKNGYNSGDTIYISKPARFVPGTNPDITSTIQAVTEEKTPLVLNIRKVVPIALTSAEIATDMSLKSWSDRILKPAVSSIAQYVDSAFLTSAVNATANFIGTPGTTVLDTLTMLQANQKINESACPDLDDRFALLNSAGNTSAVNARKGLFQQSTEIADQYRKGYMGTADGFDYLTSNLIPNLTPGTHNVTGVTINGNLTEASGAVTLAGVGNAKTIVAGEIITIAGAYAVDPITKATYPYLKQWVVTTGGTSDSGGALAIVVSPAAYFTTTPSLQNVSTLTVTGGAIAFVTSTAAVNATTSYGQNLCYHKSAFRMASVPLVMPGGLDMAAQETYKGFTIRVIRDYNVLTDQLIMRLDFLGGIAAVRPEWATRVGM